MQSGYVQAGIAEKGHGSIAVGHCRPSCSRAGPLLHHPAHGQPRNPVTIAVAGKTEESADHWPEVILRAPPEAGLSVVGSIQGTSRVIADFLQPVQQQFSLSGTKQLKGQGNTLQDRRLNLL